MHRIEQIYSSRLPRCETNNTDYQASESRIHNGSKMHHHLHLRGLTFSTKVVLAVAISKMKIKTFKTRKQS